MEPVAKKRPINNLRVSKSSVPDQTVAFTRVSPMPKRRHRSRSAFVPGFVILRQRKVDSPVRFDRGEYNP
jgi:hypothetical protein